MRFTRQDKERPSPLQRVGFGVAAILFVPALIGLAFPLLIAMSFLLFFGWPLLILPVIAIAAGLRLQPSRPPVAEEPVSLPSFSGSLEAPSAA